MKSLKGKLGAGIFMGVASHLFIKAGAFWGLNPLPAMMIGWALFMIMIQQGD